jgi:ribokinase
MPRVVVIGSANIDFTVKVDRLPKLGETVSGGEFYSSFGGKGANQAVAAHKAGAEVRFLAKVGSDQNGSTIIRHLESLGITPEGILRDPLHPTGVALIMVDQSGNNAIAVAPGSNRNLNTEEILRAQPRIAWGEVLLIQLEVPLVTVRESLRLAKAHGLRTIVNPAPAVTLPEEILSLTDILTPNEVEAETLTGLKVKDIKDATRAAKRLLESGVGQVIVTLGKFGGCWAQKNRVYSFPSFSVPAVDSTAAGDAFNGALACALAEGQPIKAALRFAASAGAMAVTKKGAQDSLPTRGEIMSLLTESQK